jgi:hypothetical protein
MIKRMIRRIRQSIGWQGKQRGPTEPPQAGARKGTVVGQLRGPAKNGVGDHSLAEVTQQAQAGSKSLGAWVGFGMEPFGWVRE